MDTENTATAGESSLTATLSETYDKLQAAETSSETAPTTADEPPAPKVETTTEEGTAAEQADKATIEPAKVEPPKSWTAAAKAKFATLDPDIQKEVLKREGDVEKGFSEYADDRKYAQSLKSVIDPYMAIITAEGGTPATAVQDLLNTAYQLRTGNPQQKAQLLQRIAQQYGVDMTLATQEAEEQYIDPLLAETQNRVKGLESEISQQRTAQAVTAINAFKSKPENVHFEALSGKMSELITAGQAKTLEDAYEQAKWLVPDVRAKILAEEKAKEEAARIEEQKAAAKAAKKAAGTQLTSKGVINAESKPASLRESLEQAYDRIAAA